MGKDIFLLVCRLTLKAYLKKKKAYVFMRFTNVLDHHHQLTKRPIKSRIATLLHCELVISAAVHGPETLYCAKLLYYAVCL